MIPNTDVYTDFHSFTEMRREAREQSSDSVKQVAKQFESLFVQMMLKSMRDAVPEGGLFNSNQEKLYRDMFDKQLSMNIASGQGVGLAAVIERQLSRSDSVDVKPESLSVPARPLAMSVAPKQTNTTTATSVQLGSLEQAYMSPAEISSVEPVDWQQPEDFVRDLWPHALEAERELGVAAEVLIAQSALETGWGKYIHSLDNGDNSFSLFGIKADQRWQGQHVAVSTLEFKDGTMQREQARFRAYDSVGEAFADYVNFIQSNPRYQQALEHGFNPDAYARELQKAGYATDPDYASKIQRIRNSDLLQNRLSELKNTQHQPLT